MIEIFLLLIFVAAIFFIMFSIFSSRRAKTIRADYRIQKGEITYSDLDKPAKALYSRRYNLTGKPDYIVKNEYGHIPVEVKNTNADYPYRSHLMQLASYCLLLEDSGKKVPFGVIVYKNNQFRIKFDGALRSNLIELINKMRVEIKSGKVEINHNQPGRCIKCSLKKYCNQKMI